MVFKRNKNKKNRSSQAPGGVTNTSSGAVVGSLDFNHGSVDFLDQSSLSNSKRINNADGGVLAGRTDCITPPPPPAAAAADSGDSGSPSGDAAFNIRSAAASASVDGGSNRNLVESGALSIPGSPLSSPNRRKGKKKMLRRVKNWMRGKKGNRRMAPINTDLLQQQEHEHECDQHNRCFGVSFLV